MIFDVLLKRTPNSLGLGGMPRSSSMLLDGGGDEIESSLRAVMMELITTSVDGGSS